MIATSNECGRTCLTDCNTPTFDSFDLESYFRYVGTSSEYLGQVHISRSSGQGQGHNSRKASACILFACGMAVLLKRAVCGVVV